MSKLITDVVTIWLCILPSCTWHAWHTVVMVLIVGSNNARGKQISGSKDIKMEARLVGLTGIQKNCSPPVHGQDDIRTEAGLTGIQINCPFHAPIWRINSTLYEPLSLDPPLGLTALGINVTIVLESYNNTEFQCYSPCGSEMYVLKSTVCHLTVMKSRKLLDQFMSIVIHCHHNNYHARMCKG